MWIKYLAMKWIWTRHHIQSMRCGFSLKLKLSDIQVLSHSQRIQQWPWLRLITQKIWPVPSVYFSSLIRWLSSVVTLFAGNVFQILRSHSVRCVEHRSTKWSVYQPTTYWKVWLKRRRKRHTNQTRARPKRNQRWVMRQRWHPNEGDPPPTGSPSKQAGWLVLRSLNIQKNSTQWIHIYDNYRICTIVLLYVR